MHPLTLLGVALGWNYVRHRRGQSTMCSTTREHVGPVPFTLCWVTLTAWLIPHYTRPLHNRKDAQPHGCERSGC